MKRTELEMLPPTIGFAVKFSVTRASPAVALGFKGAFSVVATGPVDVDALLVSDAGPAPAAFTARTWTT